MINMICKNCNHTMRKSRGHDRYFHKENITTHGEKCMVVTKKRIDANAPLGYWAEEYCGCMKAELDMLRFNL